MERYYSIENIVKKVKKDGYNMWADEFSICRSLDYFVVIFYAKYSSQGEFSFCYRLDEEKKGYIIATNVSGFGYTFPLRK